jgi:hypothetical protein
MKVRGYTVDVKSVAISSGIFVAMAVVNGAAIYTIVKLGCGVVDKSVLSDGSEYFSCDYLKNTLADSCPSGFPTTYQLCLSGFRSGVDLVSRGITEFIPAQFTQTVCNNHFGHNSSLLACYDNLNDECWSGAWGGFGWKMTVNAISTALTSELASECAKTAAYAAATGAGLTLFTGVSTGLVVTGVSAAVYFFSRRKSKNGGGASKEALTANLLADTHDADDTDYVSPKF